MDFWRHKTLAELDPQEWEQLCDGCALCCLTKLQDEDTDEVHYTAIVCDLLDQDTCRCRQYPERHRLVPDCIEINAANTPSLDWLPATCAYRLVHEGRDLYAWHHLRSGDRNTVHEAGIGVRGRVVARRHVHPEEDEDYVITWVQR